MPLRSLYFPINRSAVRTVDVGGAGMGLGVWAALGNFGKMKPECRGILTDLASWVQGVQVGISLPTFMPCPLAYPGRETKLVLDIRDTPVFPTTPRNASELTVASPVGENQFFATPKNMLLGVTERNADFRPPPPSSRDGGGQRPL